MDKLLLQGAEGALDNSIVVALTHSAHTDPKAMIVERLRVGVAGVLASSVGVVECPLQGLLDQLGPQMIRDGPADDEPRVKVQDDR